MNSPKLPFFIRFDIEDFFARINRGRVTRCLKQFFAFPYANQVAEDSTVRHPTDKDRQVIPYGFVQSPILASLALAKSRLGTVLNVLNKSNDMNVSVYVDDIIVSGNDAAGLEVARDVLVAAATRSGLAFNAAKTQGPSTLITAFNVELTHKSLAVIEERMQEFAGDMATASEESRQGILSYVQSVNSDQALELAI